MKILFGAEVKGNSGPGNVNRAMLRNLTGSFLYIRRKDRFGKLAEGLWKVLQCDVVVLSGVTKFGCILLGAAKLLGKKTVYIMHGCDAYETEQNKTVPNRKALRQEAYLLENADLLLPVSRTFMHWVQSRYPQYARKTRYLINGIDIAVERRTDGSEKAPGSILAAGGERITKNNLPLAGAVEDLSGQAQLKIYGFQDPDAWKTGFCYTQCLPSVSYASFLEEMRRAEIFVLNSTFEPFSLAVVEALLCGCSILVSGEAGVTDILALEEGDLIRNPMDRQEIGEKIRNLLENPNNSRILSQLDLRKWSVEAAVARLEEQCRQLADDPIRSIEDEKFSGE